MPRPFIRRMKNQNRQLMVWRARRWCWVASPGRQLSSGNTSKRRHSPPMPNRQKLRAVANRRQ
ncbi:hypothetical protein PFLmoz3_04636 [Pseudomonas fluorescens]|uniref:Uncharacterized protein n=1 Tax=Pseudomonas fluorescens TaxID=294 RepID=A0A120G6J7_PSEFL|nr:hypothetical protein PFLmoz3_04636 [Pseudomonas fluorescens]